MIDEKILFAPGHTACAGCGQSLAARLVVDASGRNTIVGNNTGCLEVFSTGYPCSSWRVPFIHSLFENTGAVMSGVEAALRHLGAKEGINLIAQAGDGGFGDIGLQAFSGLWERGQDILTICYDNEAYMNTGIQRSGLTPVGSRTSTTPVGPNAATGNVRSSFSFKKNLVDIALAHRCVYVATASVHLPLDLQRRVKEAHKMKGPKFLHILCPCPLGWQSDVSLTAEIGRLAVETGIWPLVEYKNGELVNVKKFKELKPVEEYLKLQRRYNHLFQGEAGAQALEAWRVMVQDNVKRYGLLEPTAQA